MNSASSAIVERICSNILFPTISQTLTQEEADAIEGYVHRAFFKESLQGAVHAGFVRLEPHQERVVKEKEDLDDKITKLTAFVGGTIFASLPDDERSRLSIQLQHMNGYSEILRQRIAAF